MPSSQGDADAERIRAEGAACRACLRATWVARKVLPTIPRGVPAAVTLGRPPRYRCWAACARMRAALASPVQAPQGSLCAGCCGLTHLGQRSRLALPPPMPPPPWRAPATPRPHRQAATRSCLAFCSSLSAGTAEMMLMLLMVTPYSDVTALAACRAATGHSESDVRWCDAGPRLHCSCGACRISARC